MADGVRRVVQTRGLAALLPEAIQREADPPQATLDAVPRIAPLPMLRCAIVVGGICTRQEGFLFATG
jgi:hypothetical protein